MHFVAKAMPILTIDLVYIELLCHQVIGNMSGQTQVCVNVFVIEMYTGCNNFIYYFKQCLVKSITENGKHFLYVY